MQLKVLLGLFLAISLVAGQEEGSGDNNEAEEPETKAGSEDECEEAWEYLEFLKKEIRDKVETILQEKLFEPKSLLEATVADTMSETLVIRDAVLDRTKKIRTKSPEITICPGQGVNQEEFLSMIRMDIMTVLLTLIQPGAATPEKLQQIGRELLSVRTKVNGEITRIIMLRESGIIPTTREAKDCDCGILQDIVDGLNKVVSKGEGADGNSTETEGGDDMNPVEGLTMVLMTIDARIRELYNEILGQLDEEKRQVSSDELQNLKDITSELNLVISDMVDSNPETDSGKRKIAKLVDKDVSKIRSDVERQLTQCIQKCPSDCKSCGSEKIEELKSKLADFKSVIEDLEEEDSREAVRNELMQYLTEANKEMTELLTDKANSENGSLPLCDAEKLKVLDSIKGPLWMLVNITIFGDEDTMSEMIIAFDEALDQMRGEYCTSQPRAVTIPTDDNTCDLDEIEAARQFISDIDDNISANLFKTNDDEARKKAMLGYIELKSAMDERVRTLFSESLRCSEEVSQLKNIYMDQITNCLSEMMNPRYRFETLSRAERVACIKQLRTTIEDRRGELLMREIERRINEQPTEASNDVPEY